MMTGAAPSPDVQPIASKWQLDYAPGACRLLATFGTDRDTVVFTRASPRAPMQLTLVSAAWPTTAMSRKVAVVVAGGPPLMLDSVPLPRSGPVRYLHMEHAAGLREALDGAAAQTGGTTLVATTTGRSRAYAIGKAAPLLAALDRCTDDMVRSWGFDPVELRGGTDAKPATPPWTWATAADYPLRALSNGTGGGVELRLDIDVTGHVTDCHVMEAGGDPEFRALSCDLLRRRALYHPATNRAGVPIASYAIYRVRWSM